MIEEEFLLGPAVDEAASEREASRRGVRLAHPFFPAQCAVEKFNAWLCRSVPLVEYSVPMKDGHRYKTHVVNPTYRFQSLARSRFAGCWRRSIVPKTSTLRSSGNTQRPSLRALAAVRNSAAAE